MRISEPVKSKLELMQGTLDMLVLGPAHGHEIAKRIQRTINDVLQAHSGGPTRRQGGW